MKPDIGRESRFLPPPPAFEALVRGDPRRNIAITFGMKKTMWLPDGENNSRYVYSFRQNTRTWQTDGRTDGRTDG